MRAQALGNIAKARKRYWEILRHFPKDANALYLLANLDIKDGQYDSAVELITKARKAHPRHAGFLYLLGYTLFLIGRPFDATRYLKKAVKFDPDYQLAILLLANLYRRTGQYELGRAQLDAVNEKKITDPEELLTAATVLRDYRFLSRSRRIVDDAITRDSMRPEALYELTLFPGFRISAEHQALIADLLDDDKLDTSRKYKLEFAAGRIADSEGRFGEAFGHFEKANALYITAKGLLDPPFDLDRYDESINAVTDLFNAEFFASRQGHSMRTALPVFIVGLPRAGKSLVESTLAHHPDVFGAGEISLDSVAGPEFVMRLDGSLPSDYQKSVRTLSAGGTKSLADKYVAHLGRYSSNALRVINTLPQNFNNIGLIKLMFRDARIINVRRDPWDVCLFCYAKNFENPHGYSNDLRILGGYHERYVRIMEHWSALFCEDIVDVRYEEFVTQPQAASARIFDFLGLAELRQAAGDESRSKRRVDLEYGDQPIERKYVGHAAHYEPYMRGVLGDFGWPKPEWSGP